MRKGIVFLTAIILGNIVSLFAQCVEQSEVYEFEHDDRKYEVIKTKKNWSDAASCAVERGGVLVEVNNSAEQDAVYDAIINGANVPVDYAKVNSAGGIAYVWIGASDAVTEGAWLWDGNNSGEGTNFWKDQGANGNGDGEEVNDLYNNWGGKSTGTVQEPDDYAGQDNAGIGLEGWPLGTTSLGSAGEWNDIASSSKLYFVIEYSYASSVESNTENINIYPNPTEGVVHVGKNVENITLVDVYGKQYLFEPADGIDISNLDAGVYIIRLTKNNNTYTETIIKN